MRKVTRILAIALLIAGSATLTADAQTSRGAGNINTAARNFTPIDQVACVGWGAARQDTEYVAAGRLFRHCEPVAGRYKVSVR